MAESRPRLRAPLVIVAGLTALAAGLRFPTLGLQSYWYDEVQTIFVLRNGLAPLGHTESTPPGYFALALAWSRLFGTGEAGLRSLSAVAGTATVPLAYAAARSLVGERAGLITAALAAVSPILVWYSQEARAYALVVFFTTLSLLCFARSRQGAPRWVLAWAIAAALAVATHYFAIFVVAAEALLLARVVDRRVLLGGLAVGGLGAAQLLPLALRQAQNPGLDGIDVFTLGYRAVYAIAAFLAAPLSNPVPALVVVSGLLVLAAFVLAWGTEGELGRGALIALAIGGTGVAAPLGLAAIGIDYFLPRNVIAAWVPLAVVVAAGFASPRAPRLGPALAAGLCAVLLAVDVAVALTPRLHREDWRHAARLIAPGRAPRAIVVVPGFSALALRHYRPGLRPMPPGGAFVHEAVAVILPGHRGAPVPDLRRLGLKPVAGQSPARLALVRYRSPRPVRLSAQLLLTRRALPPGARDAVVLYQPAARPSPGG